MSASLPELPTIDISADTVFRWLLVFIVFIIFMFIATQVLLDGCSSKTCLDTKDFFRLDVEVSLPTWFSSTLWLLAAGATGLIAFGQRQDKRHWCGLAILFAFLSMDEGAAFHERIGGAFGSIFSAKDYLFYNWLLYGLLFVAIIGLIYLPFLLRLPASTRRGLILAGVVFITGAIGMEMIGGAARAGAIPWNSSRIFWGIQFTVEEGLEMLGVSLLIRTLLRHMAEYQKMFYIRVTR